MGYSEELWLACGKYSKSLAAVIICTVAVIVKKSHKGFYWAGNIKTGCSERDGEWLRLCPFAKRKEHWGRDKDMRQEARDNLGKSMRLSFAEGQVTQVNGTWEHGSEW